MKIPSDDEIQKFFDNLSPTDFLVEDDDVTSSGEPDERYPLPTTTEDYPRFGEEEFDRFTLDNLHRLATEMVPFAALHNGTANHHYTMMPNEDVYGFLQRMRAEAKIFSAKWFFVGTPGEASMGAVFDPNDHKDVENARRQGRMMEVINWYSESIEPTSKEVRFGILYEEGNEKRIVQSTYEKGANPAFKKVLR